MPSFTPKPTKQVLMLADALEKRGVELELEHWDGHKHIDIYIPKDHLYIEVDGVPHYTDHQKMIADFNRDYFSFKGGYFTKRIANETIESHVEATPSPFATVALNAPNRLGERVVGK